LAIGILFRNPSKHNGRNPNKSKIIQENLDTQNAFILLELPFKSWRNSFRREATTLRLKIKANAAIKTKLLVSKELAHFSEQIHDGENCLCGSLEHLM
jgi:exonuclease SbcC